MTKYNRERLIKAEAARLGITQATLLDEGAAEHYIKVLTHAVKKTLRTMGSDDYAKQVHQAVATYVYTLKNK